MATRVLSWVVGVILAGLYVYATITGIGNLIGMLGLGGALGTGLSAVGWLWLVFGIVMPLGVLIGGLLLARGRGAGIRILVLATGIALVAAVQLDVMHVIPESSYFV